MCGTQPGPASFFFFWRKLVMQKKSERMGWGQCVVDGFVLQLSYLCMVVSKHYVQLPLLKNRDKKCAIVCVLGLRESEDALTMYRLHLHPTREDAHLISTMLPNLFSNHLFYFLAPLSYVCSSLPLVQGLLVYIRHLLQNNVLVFFFF